MYGEGDYSLTAIKEIETTDAFLGLDEEIRNCQTVETFEECQAKEYIEIGLDRCKCTTYELRNFLIKVNKKEIFYQNVYY